MPTGFLSKPVLIRQKRRGRSHVLFSQLARGFLAKQYSKQTLSSLRAEGVHLQTLSCVIPPYTHQIASFCSMNYNRPWLTGTQWIKQCLPMSRWTNMAVRGVLEQRWSRSTSDSGSLRQLLMPRWVSARRLPNNAVRVGRQHQGLLGIGVPCVGGEL